ncbi:MAG: NAD-binding protein [Coriobacteriia bacterium]|nr:NAD-binding protein [Coriobacteriia bacterium]
MSDNTSYVFAGDTAVGEGIVGSLARAGFTAAADLAQAGVVFTYHPTQSGLEELYFGDDGIVAQVAAGTVFVNLSPAAPSFSSELYQLCSVYECNYVEAPLVVRDVTVEDAFAEPGNLLVFAAGEQGAFDEVEPQLSALARMVEFVGGIGAAQTAKVVHTLQNATGLMGIVEAFASTQASKADFDGEAYLDALESAGLVSPAQVAFVEALNAGDFEGSYTLGLMMAELAVALTAVEDEEMVLPLGDAAFHLFELLAIVGGANYTPAALKLLFADEEAGKAAGLDWSRAEHDHDHECDCADKDDPDHECSCGHHHHRHDDELDQGVGHHHHQDEDAFDEEGNYNEFGGYGTPSTSDYIVDEVDDWN